MNKPLIGEIWITAIPIIYYEDNNINVKIQKRPVLILDDGRGLIVEEDKRNYHVFKLTSQSDSYKRKLIKNWKEIGLKKKSYVRIEMPIKIEESQFINKITEISTKDLKEYYIELFNILNINVLKKIAESEKLKNWKISLFFYVIYNKK